MIPGLLVTNGPKRGIYITLTNQKPFWIGRNFDADFRLADDFVSGKHCYFLREGNLLYIQDESKNGVMLHGMRVRKTKLALKNADILCVGETHFQVIDVEELQYEENYQNLFVPTTQEIDFSYDVCMEIVERRKGEKIQAGLIERIGPYINVEIIGFGSTGTVFKSVHQEQKNLVALKVMTNLEKLSLDFVKRFYREVDLLKKLSHPSIIRFYDTGNVRLEEKDYRYIALEYFQGVHLRSHLEANGILSWQKVFQILYQILQALDYMHSQQILHRDLKPNNMMYNDIKNVAKIIDLGLGKSLNHEERKTFFTTKPETALGTPNFMPLEQWYGTKNITARSDIYSLGATAYYLLTSHCPYGDHHQDVISLYEDVLHKKMIPLEAVISPEVPQSFVKILNKMLAYEPQDRYPDCPTVLHELQETFEKVLRRRW